MAGKIQRRFNINRNKLSEKGAEW